VAEVLVRPGDVIFPALDGEFTLSAQMGERLSETLEREMPGVKIGFFLAGARDTLVYRPVTFAEAPTAELDAAAQRARAAYAMAAYGVEPGEWADANEGEQRRWRLVAEAVHGGRET